jgi:hypothetical protein
LQPGPAAVGISSEIDVEHEDDVLFVVNAVADPVLTTPSASLPVEESQGHPSHFAEAPDSGRASLAGALLRDADLAGADLAGLTSEVST